MLKISLSLAFVLTSGTVFAQPPAEPQQQAQPTQEAQEAKQDAKPDPKQQGKQEVKTLSGMSVLGNQEAPTSLVIVPWKSSQMGDGIGVSKSLDTKIRPVDMDVFLRELRYYQIRSSGK